MNPVESWTGWAVKCFLKTPMFWSFTKLKMDLMESDINESEYVCISFLKVFTYVNEFFNIYLQLYIILINLLFLLIDYFPEKDRGTCFTKRRK